MKILTLLFNFLNIFNFASNYNTELILDNTKKSESVVAVSEESYVTTNAGDSYLYYQDEMYLIENHKISKTLETINTIYLIERNNKNTTIIGFNKFNKSLTYKIVDNFFLENIYDIDNTLYLVGNMNDDGVIYVLSYDLVELNKRMFYGGGYITVNHLIYDNEFFYVTIHKDGITNNSEFINHGNLDERKSIIVKLDNKFSILDIYYFNEYSGFEIVKNIYLNDTLIKVLLKTNRCYYIYNLDKDFKKITSYKLSTTDDIELLKHFKSKKVDLFLNKSTCSLITNDKESIKVEQKFDCLKKVNDYKIIDGLLYLYSLDNGVKIYKVSEYEIIKNDNKVLNYFNLNYLDTSNVVVEAWFFEPKIIIDSLNPYFDKTMCGEYEITYHILKNDTTIDIINSNLIVEEYTNFINNGIYNEGKVLEFFGSAKINDEIIYYGTKLDVAGEYDIEIMDINKVTTNYHIYIVPNYYKEETTININSKDVHGDVAYVNIELNNENVKEVIVNNQSYDNYEIIDNVLVISFPRTIESVSSNVLNGIIFLDDEVEYYYKIDEQLIFNYLKNAPDITINQIIEENNFNVELSIDDVEKTFMYLKAVYAEKEKVISSSDVISASNLELYFVYDLGNGKLNEFLISEIKQDQLFDTNIEIVYENNVLKEIKIRYSINCDSLKVLNVNTSLDNVKNSYLEYYEKLKPTSYLKSIIIISISIFLVSGLIFLGYLMVKKHQTKSF